MSVEILISAMNNAFDLKFQRPDHVEVLVINQITSDDLEEAERYKKAAVDQDVRVFNYMERGISKSRNRALAEAQGDICIIADDDVIFDADIGLKVESAFMARPDADVISFQARDSRGQPIRRYRASEHIHTKLTSFNVVSFGIAFRRARVVESGALFDERFGLGADFVSGEENIFVSDLIDADLKAVYIPFCAVTHPGETSGGQFQSDAVVRSKGAIIRRIYGACSWPLVFAFAFRKRKQMNGGLLKALSMMMDGWRDFSNSATPRIK